MNTRAFTLALIIAIFASYMVYVYIEERESELKEKYGTPRSVVIAKQDIGELELIDDSKVTIISMPSSFVSPGSYKAISEVENTVASVPILKGEQITKPRIAYPGAKTGLSRQVSVGKRAISIAVSSEFGVSNLIKPGDRVDVLAPIDYTGGEMDNQKTSTVLQDVLVLSTGFNMTNNLPIIGMKYPKVIKEMNLNIINNYKTVTLELDPFQAQKLVYISQFGRGRIHLSLRNNSDKSKVRIQPTGLFDVLNEEEASKAKQYFIEKKLKEKGGR